MVRDILRARIALASHVGSTNAAIARQLGITDDTVRKWRRGFHHAGRDGLMSRPRSGRPPRFTTVAVAEMRALACALPAEHHIPLSRWSHAELATEAAARGVVDSVST